MSFLESASKKATDVREFLKESANSNSLKYKAEKGQKHFIYIPYVIVQSLDEEGQAVNTKSLIAISGKSHDWNTSDGKYKTTICLKDVVREGENGVMLNDGSCPFCDRKDDGWDIHNYRMAQEEKCGKVGEELKVHLEDARKRICIS